MACSGDVRAMSPQETSKWCSSLALCGVRGRVLRDLQDQILRRQIDGYSFDRMLRSNTLKDLDVEELNPRLVLAIRRSWTTDFGSVTFIEYGGGQAYNSGPGSGPHSPYGGHGDTMPARDDMHHSLGYGGRQSGASEPAYSRAYGLAIPNGRHGSDTSAPSASPKPGRQISEATTTRTAVPWATSGDAMDFSASQDRRTAYGSGSKQQPEDPYVGRSMIAAGRRSGPGSGKTYDDDDSVASGPSPPYGGVRVGGSVGCYGHPGGYGGRDDEVGPPAMRGLGCGASGGGCGGRPSLGPPLEPEGGLGYPPDTFGGPHHPGDFRSGATGMRGLGGCGGGCNGGPYEDDRLGPPPMRSSPNNWGSPMGPGPRGGCGGGPHDDGLQPPSWQRGGDEAMSPPPWSGGGSGYPEQRRYHGGGHSMGDASGGSFPSHGGLYGGRVPESHMQDDRSPPPTPPDAQLGGGRTPPQDFRMDTMRPGGPRGGSGPGGGGAWAGGLDEAFEQRRPAAHAYSRPEAAYETMRGGDRMSSGGGDPRMSVGDPRMGGGGGGRGGGAPMDWGAGGLEDMLPPRRSAASNAAQDWGGGGLDEMLPPRRAGGPNIAQANAADSMNEPRRGPASRSQGVRNEAAADWGGMSLDDVMAPRRRGEPSSGGGGACGRGGLASRGGGLSRGDGFGDGFDNGPPPRQDRYGDLGPPARQDRFDDGSVENDFDIDRRHDREPSPADSGSGRPSAAFGRPPSGPGMGRQSGGSFSGGGVVVSSPSAPAPAPAPRSRQKHAAPADDGWGGQSLADAFAPKKAAPPGGGGDGGLGPRRGPSRGGSGAAASAPVASAASASGGSNGGGKKTADIISWVRSLPESHVPEKSRNNIAAIVEDNSYDGRQFTDYIQSVPPEVCAPKHAMKLKAAWKNVLNESNMQEAARSNLENQPRQKATMLVC